MAFLNSSIATSVLLLKNAQKMMAYKFIKMETDPTRVKKISEVSNLAKCICFPVHWSVLDAQDGLSRPLGRKNPSLESEPEGRADGKSSSTTRKEMVEMVNLAKKALWPSFEFGMLCCNLVGVGSPSDICKDITVTERDLAHFLYPDLLVHDMTQDKKIATEADPENKKKGKKTEKNYPCYNLKKKTGEALKKWIFQQFSHAPKFFDAGIARTIESLQSEYGEQFDYNRELIFMCKTTGIPEYSSSESQRGEGDPELNAIFASAADNARSSRDSGQNLLPRFKISVIRIPSVSSSRLNSAIFCIEPLDPLFDPCQVIRYIQKAFVISEQSAIQRACSSEGGGSYRDRNAMAAASSMGTTYGSQRPFSSRKDVNAGSFYVENKQEDSAERPVKTQNKSITDGMDYLMNPLCDYSLLKDLSILETDFEKESKDLRRNGNNEIYQAEKREFFARFKHRLESVYREWTELKTQSKKASQTMQYEEYARYSHPINPRRLFTFDNAVKILGLLECKNERFNRFLNSGGREESSANAFPFVNFYDLFEERRREVSYPEGEGDFTKEESSVADVVTVKDSSCAVPAFPLNRSALKRAEIYSYPAEDFYWMTVTDTMEVKGLACQLFPWVESVYLVKDVVTSTPEEEEREGEEDEFSLSSCSMGLLRPEAAEGIPFDMFVHSKTFMPNSRLPVIRNMHLLHQACLLPRYEKMDAKRPLDARNVFGNMKPFSFDGDRTVHVSKIATGSLSEREMESLVPENFNAYVAESVSSLEAKIARFNSFAADLDKYSFDTIAHFKETFVNKTNVEQFVFNDAFKHMIRYHLDSPPEYITPSSFPGSTLGVGTILPQEDLSCEHVANSARRFASLVKAKGVQKQKILTVLMMVAWGHMDPSPMGIHVLLNGKFAVGKSWMLEFVPKFTVPGIVKNMSDFTKNSFMIDGDFSGLIYCFEELSQVFFNGNSKGGNVKPGGADTDRDNMINILKCILTDGNFSKQICDITFGRVMRVVMSKFVVRMVAASNDSKAQLDQNVASRVSQHTIGDSKSQGTWDSALESTPKGTALKQKIEKLGPEEAGLVSSRHGKNDFFVFPQEFLREHVKERELLDFFKNLYCSRKNAVRERGSSSWTGTNDDGDEEQDADRKEEGSRKRPLASQFDQTNALFTSKREDDASESFLRNIRFETLLMFYCFMAISEKSLNVSSHLFWCLVPKFVYKLKQACPYVKIDNRTFMRAFCYALYITVLSANREEFFSPVDVYTGKKNPKYVVPFQSHFVSDIAPRLFMRVSAVSMAFTLVAEEFIDPWDSQVCNIFFFLWTGYGNFVRNLALHEKKYGNVVHYETETNSDGTTSGGENVVKQKGIRIPRCFLRSHHNKLSLFKKCKFARFYNELADVPEVVINMNYVVLEEDCKTRDVNVVMRQLADKLDAKLNVGTDQLLGMIRKLKEERVTMETCLDNISEKRLNEYIKNDPYHSSSSGNNLPTTSAAVREDDFFTVPKVEKKGGTSSPTLLVNYVKSSSADLSPKSQIWLCVHALARIQSDKIINSIIKETLSESRMKESLFRLFNVDPNTNTLKAYSMKGKGDDSSPFTVDNDTEGLSTGASRDGNDAASSGTKMYFDYLKANEVFLEEFKRQSQSITEEVARVRPSSDEGEEVRDTMEIDNPAEPADVLLKFDIKDVKKDREMFQKFIKKMEKELPEKSLDIGIDLDEWAAHEHLFSTHCRSLKVERTRLNAEKGLEGFRILYFHKKIPIENLHRDEVQNAYEGASSGSSAEEFGDWRPVSSLAPLQVSESLFKHKWSNRIGDPLFRSWRVDALERLATETNLLKTALPKSDAGKGDDTRVPPGGFKYLNARCKIPDFLVDSCIEMMSRTGTLPQDTEMDHDSTVHTKSTSTDVPEINLERPQKRARYAHDPFPRS